MAYQDTSSGGRDTIASSPTHLQRQSHTALAQEEHTSMVQVVMSLQNEFHQERRRREDTDNRIAAQLERILSFLDRGQKCQSEEDQQGQRSGSARMSQYDSGLSQAFQAEGDPEKPGTAKALDEIHYPSARRTNIDRAELCSDAAPLGPPLQLDTEDQFRSRSSFVDNAKEAAEPYQEALPDSAEQPSDESTLNLSRSSSELSDPSSPATCRLGSTWSSSQVSGADTPDTSRASATKDHEKTSEQARSTEVSAPRRSSPLPKDIGKQPRSEESTVEVVASQGPSIARKGKGYTQFEKEFIGKTVQRLCGSGVRSSKAITMVAAQLAEMGYERTPEALTVYWYTKLKHSYPLQPECENSDLEIADDVPVISTKRTTVVRTRNGQGRFVRPTSTTDPVKLEKGQDDPAQTESARSQSLRHLPDSELLYVRLGVDCSTRRHGDSPKNQLRSHAGRHFVVDNAWTGASNDIIDAAWSPDGSQYIMGSAAMEHPYNRPNNLLLGDLNRNQLREIPGHREQNSRGNASLLDPYTYHTVCNVAWNANSIYTAGYDGMVKVWDADNPVTYKFKMPHNRRIETMAVSNTSSSLIATATDSGPDSLRLYSKLEEGGKRFKLPLPEKSNNAPFSHTPMCMKFSGMPNFSDHLLAGFGSSATFDDGSPSPRGFLGLWRIGEGRADRIRLNPCTQQVFDVAWSEQSSLFLSGNTIGRRVAGVGSTLVRIYDCGRSDAIREATCPAIDMNDVSICPFDEKIFSAACTDGNTYMWDMRNLTAPLHILEHGPNVSGHDSEITDTGVRVVQWGNDRSEFFTGGSDGVLKLWDIRKGSSDVLVEDVISCGIELMCGKLSPDKTKFLVGDASGSLQILSRSPCRGQEPPEKIEFSYLNTKASARQYGAEDQGHEGRKAAAELVATGQIVIDPVYGPGQGPKYSGPYAAYARPPNSDPESLGKVSLLHEYASKQRFNVSTSKATPVKRKRKDSGSSRPSKKTVFKIRKPASKIDKIDQEAAIPPHKRHEAMKVGQRDSVFRYANAVRLLPHSIDAAYELGVPLEETEALIITTKSGSILGWNQETLMNHLSVSRKFGEDTYNNTEDIDVLASTLTPEQKRRISLLLDLDTEDDDQDATRFDTPAETAWAPEGALNENSSDLEDDGYVPPHWMVDANLKQPTTG